MVLITDIYILYAYCIIIYGIGICDSGADKR